MLPSARRFFSSGRKSTFVDRLRIYARGGAGGQGSPSWGGVGGDGGDVRVCAGGRGSLSELVRQSSRLRFVAASGRNSSKRRGSVFEEKARDTVIQVPAGTVVLDNGGQQIADLECEGEGCVLVRGGGGGRTCLTSQDYQGSKGERGVFTLELKMIADIGMVGFPNAGKSTLLKALSNASPKIASYAFTTVRPQLGVMSHDSGRPITIADLPGLVEGAHINVGMGHRFLRHLERTKLLLYVVDITGFQLSDKHPFRDALEGVCLLGEELEQYSTGLLSERPAVLAVNKMDSEGSRERLDYLLSNLPMRFSHVAPISAQLGTGLQHLKQLLIDTLISAESAK